MEPLAAESKGGPPTALPQLGPPDQWLACLQKAGLFPLQVAPGWRGRSWMISSPTYMACTSWSLPPAWQKAEETPWDWATPFYQTSHGRGHAILSPRMILFAPCRGRCFATSSASRHEPQVALGVGTGHDSVGPCAGPGTGTGGSVMGSPGLGLQGLCGEGAPDIRMPWCAGHAPPIGGEGPGLTKDRGVDGTAFCGTILAAGCPPRAVSLPPPL